MNNTKRIQRKKTEESKIKFGAKPYVSSFQDEKRFSQTKNPVYIIKAFIEAYEQGINPPQWALNFVAKVFKKFDADYGKTQLNSLFGFKKGKGQCPAYIEYLTEKRYKILCMDVFLLVNFLDMPVGDACSLVATRLEETSDYHMGCELKKISDETIKSKYFKRWGKKFNNSSPLKEYASNPPEEDVIKFLKKFPKESLDSYKSICPALRAYLKLV